MGQVAITHVHVGMKRKEKLSMCKSIYAHQQKGNNSIYEQSIVLTTVLDTG
jgi:hypothetical protein